MLWIADRIGVDRKLVVRAECDCARTSLKFVPKGEKRPLIAIQTAERWCRGEATIEEVRSAAYAAYAADAASASAAYAAYAAAASASAASAAYAAYAAAASASAASDAYAAYAAAASASAASDAYAAYAAAARAKALKQCADLVRKRIRGAWSGRPSKTPRAGRAGRDGNLRRRTRSVTRRA